MTTFAFAAFAKGVTGLGFSVVSISLLATIIGLKDALPLVLIPSLASNLMVMAGAGHFRETVNRFHILFLLAPVGVLVGLWLLLNIDGDDAGGILGLVLLGYVAFAFAKPNVTLPAHLEPRLSGPTGFLTGVINGVTGVQIMPILPFLMALNMTPNRLIQALNCSFTISTIAFGIGLWFVEALDLGDILIAAPGIAITYIGVRFGERVRAGLGPEQFRRLVLLLVAFLALTLLGKAFTL